MSTVVVTSASFPASGGNRPRNAAISELTEWTGSGNRPEMQVRAGRSWDSAVRQFNAIAWRFNRMQDDITLSSTSGTTDYTLNTDFRSPLRAMLLDSDSKIAGGPLRWIPYIAWTASFPDQTGTGSEPEFYTVRNEHETGVVTVDPPTSGSNTYPTLRIDYHRRILTQAGDTGVLNVPQEMDEAIFQLALAIFISKVRSYAEARDQFTLAARLRAECERMWRDYDEQGN